MAARRCFIAGHNVEVWETSFRLEGMSRPIHVGRHISDESIEQMITTIHEAVALQAEKEGRQRAADAINAQINKLILED